MEGGFKKPCGGEELFNDKIHSANKDIQLQRAKAEMFEVREENQRLKKHLSQILNDFKTLQKQFNDIIGQEGNESTTYDKSCFRNLESEESQFVSLSLGRTSSAEPIRDEKSRSTSIEDKKFDKDGLSLELDCNFENTTEFLSKIGSENSGPVVKEYVRELSSPRHIAAKTKRSEDEEASPQNPAKRARVSVRVRCDTPTMNDGCQWRKYGQKVSKGNPCPRAYYRCTVGPSCSARKQVQRCIDDMSILITTYEGTHNHSLPISATVMASATSAAASMLLSGSSTSPSSLTTSSPLHGINYYLSNNPRTNQLYLSPSCPTVTLDLTSPSSASHFNKLYSNLFPTPEYNNSSTNLSFSSLEANPWSIGTLSCDKNSLVENSLDFARSAPHERYHQSYLPKTNSNRNPQQQMLAQDNIAVATKAITSDPSFQSALVTAISSIIGNRGSGGEMIRNQIRNSNKLEQNLKFGEDLLRMGTQIENRYKL